jgi:hypothetical protein
MTSTLCAAGRWIRAACWAGRRGRSCAARPRLPGGSAPPSPSPQRPPGPSRSAPRPALVACSAGSPFNEAQGERVPERLMISSPPTIAVALAPPAALCPTGRRPVRGALAPVADVRLGIWGRSDRVSVASRMPCLGPGREGRGITSGRRDARGLTFSAVIPARVLQPEVSTRRKQSWHIALCAYGLTLAPRHRVHLVCVASLAHLRRAHRLG